MKLGYGSSRHPDTGWAGIVRFDLSFAPEMEARQSLAHRADQHAPPETRDRARQDSLTTGIQPLTSAPSQSESVVPCQYRGNIARSSSMPGGYLLAPAKTEKPGTAPAWPDESSNRGPQGSDIANREARASEACFACDTRTASQTSWPRDPQTWPRV